MYLKEVTAESYSAPTFEQFVYDVEYFANADSWTGNVLDREYMWFKEFGYNTPDSYSYSSLEELRSEIEADVADYLANLPLSKPYVWMDVVNVSASSDGSTIFAKVGAGGNFDPCPGPKCPPEAEELAEDFVATGGGSSNCVLPTSDKFPVTTLFADPSCSLGEMYGALDYAKDFSNRGVLVQGVLEPGECNPVNPEIFTNFTNIPRSNLHAEIHISFDFPFDVDGLCFTKYPVYDFVKLNNSICDGEVFDCLPGDQARTLMQSIGTAIAQLEDGTVPSNIPGKSRFYCTTEYYPARPLCCDGDPEDPCCVNYYSVIETLWHEED